MMMNAFSLFVLSFALLVPSLSQAAELRYRWQAGQTQRFRVVSDDTVSLKVSGMGGMGAMMGGMNAGGGMTTRMETVFGLQVQRVRADGTAEAVLHIESFKVTDPKGRRLAGIDKLPPKALKQSVDVDPKGRFTFKEVVYILMDEKSGTSQLVSAKVGPNGASASAQMDGEKVSVYAEFDPKTGTMKGGYKIEKMAEPPAKKKKVAVRRDAKKVDLLPTGFLEILRLPNGTVSVGSKTKAKIANYTMGLEVHGAPGGKLRIASTVGTEGDQPDLSGKASVESDEGGGFGMDMGGMMGGMGGMDDMGGDEGDGMPTMGGKAPMMKVNGQFDLIFDPKMGRLVSLKGTMDTETSMGGMGSMTHKSQVALTGL
ncbi:MAG: hypothetical protein CMH55_09905 [Myxococcales bacterium]|nr:hypothetical protein [Myxococcales bacterium]